jgi:cation diffusion facilitator family transporter
MARSLSSKPAVYAGLVGNLLVAATKAGAAVWTGSSAMLSEAVHSLVDSGNEVLLLYGMRRSQHRPDPDHPLGYGRELYFWSFIVALLVFALGGGISIYEGIAHIRDPEPMSDPHVNYIVLALAFVFEAGSWTVALRQFAAAKGSLGFYEAFRRSKDPPSFMVLFEDSAALLGILIAAVGTVAAVRLDAPMFDGLASVLIGLVLAGTAVLLASESKSLLIGERADDRLTESVLRVARTEGTESRPNGLLTVQLAPDQILVALSIKFADRLSVPDIERTVVAIERNIRKVHPEVVAVFVKPQTEDTFRDAMSRRFGKRGSARPPHADRPKASGSG